MNSIPVLRFPHLVQTEIVNHLDLHDLFKLSILSKKTAAAVQLSRRHVDVVKWEFFKGQSFLRFSQNPTPPLAISDFLTFGFRDGHDFYDLRGGFRFKGARMNLGNLHLRQWDCQLASHITILNHFLNMVIVRRHVLVIAESQPKELEFWRYTEHFGLLVIGDSITRVTITGLLAHRILHTIRAYSIHLNMNPVTMIDYSLALNFKILEAASPSWLRFETLLRSPCKYLLLYDYCPSNAEFNSLIKTWLSKTGLDNLSLLQMETSGGNRSKYAISTEIKISDSTKASRPPFVNYGPSRFNIEKGRDVQRSDGKIMTVCIFPNNLIFHVRDN